LAQSCVRVCVCVWVGVGVGVFNVCGIENCFVAQNRLIEKRKSMSD
jgi:hypothetical protein